MSLKALTSAYRFAPISRWVYTPPWGPYVSRDVPLKGAVSGEMKIKITTLTETCVGGARKGPDVQPFRLHAGGQFAIPASTLDGLLRSTLEVVTFGRLGEFVEKRWPGIRDISGDPGVTVKKRYSNRMVKIKNTMSGIDITSQVRAGWLLKQDDVVNLIPCQLGRVDIQDVKNHFKIQSPEWEMLAKGGNTTPERYKLLGFNSKKPFDARFSFCVDDAAITEHLHRSGKLRINERRHLNICASGGIDATLVLTGKPASTGDPYGVGKKKREFLFSKPSRRELMNDPKKYDWHSDFPAETLAAFKYLTSRSDGGRSHAAWSFWKSFFDRGEPVPVFYIEDAGAVSAMGMAQMFKAAFGASTHDLLKNSNAEHLVEQSSERFPDFPSTLLGEKALYDTDDAKTTGRAGRITFTPARAVSLNGQKIPQDVTLETRSYVLSSPKEGYYPLYVRQDEYADRKSKSMATFANVTDVYEHRAFVRKPELAGTKIWPAGDGAIRRQDADQSHGHNEDGGAASRVSFLPSGITFEGRIVFHNVLPQELGAVIWALTAGSAGNEKPVLRLGTAKAYGHGQVEIELELTDLIPTVKEMRDLETIRTSFSDHMESVVEASGLDGSWEETKQVKAILESRQRNHLELGVMDTKQHAHKRYAQIVPDPFPSRGVEFKKNGAKLTIPTIPQSDEPDDPPLDKPPPAGSRVTVRRGATGRHAIRIGQEGKVGEEELSGRNKLKIYFGDETQPTSVPFTDLRIL